LDWAKGEALSIAVTVPLIWLLYLVLRRWSRRAWLVFWLASLPLVAAVVFVMPVVVDPLFDKFTPLADTQPALVAEIEKVTRRGGLDIPRERIFEMEASGKTRALNAYVTGLGATKRVVVWDTTAREMTPDQTLFVFGHEMGHYVLNHVFKGLALGCLGSLALFWLAFHLSRRLVARYGKRLGVNGLDDWAALPLILLVAAVLSFAGEPVANAFSRHLEHEADVYALEITRGVIPDNQKAGAEAFQILGEKSLAHPNPPAFVKFWLFSHPPIAERLKFAREYVP
jgi:Zn-dependent protease with chaperone function